MGLVILFFLFKPSLDVIQKLVHESISPFLLFAKWIFFVTFYKSYIFISSCEGEMSSINVEFSVGITELDLSSTLTAFPNPATTQVQINFESDLRDGQVDCKMRTITGQLVSTFLIIDGYATIDVSSLANGTYILSLQTERGIVRQSLVVSH